MIIAGSSGQDCNDVDERDMRYFEEPYVYRSLITLTDKRTCLAQRQEIDGQARYVVHFDQRFSPAKYRLSCDHDHDFILTTKFYENHGPSSNSKIQNLQTYTWDRIERDDQGNTRFYDLHHMCQSLLNAFENKEGTNKWVDRTDGTSSRSQERISARHQRLGFYADTRGNGKDGVYDLVQCRNLEFNVGNFNMGRYRDGRNGLRGSARLEVRSVYPWTFNGQAGCKWVAGG